MSSKRRSYLTERKRAERTRWRDAGFRMVTVWIHEEDWQILREYVDRKNAKRGKP